MCTLSIVVWVWCTLHGCRHCLAHTRQRPAGILSGWVSPTFSLRCHIPTQWFQLSLICSLLCEFRILLHSCEQENSIFIYIVAVPLWWAVPLLFLPSTMSSLNERMNVCMTTILVAHSLPFLSFVLCCCWTKNMNVCNQIWLWHGIVASRH